MANQNRQKPEKQEDFSLKETSPNISGRKTPTSLMSSYDLVEKMIFLYVKVVKAVNLPQPTDPFVQVRLENCKATTKVLEKTANPEWGVVFAFSKDRIQAHTVEISVMNKAASSDGVLGRVVLNIGDIPIRVLPDSQLAPQWYRLEDTKGIKVKGALMLAVWIGTQADEDYADAWHSDIASSVNATGCFLNTQSKIYHSPKLWYLRLNVIEVKDFVLKDNKRNPELLVEAKLGPKVKLMTKISESKDAKNPIWNEDMIFVAAEPFDDLLLEVVDVVAPNKGEVLGRCRIVVSSVQKRIDATPVDNKWYNLERPDKREEGEASKMKFVGRIHMRVCLEGGYHVLDEPIHYASDLRPTSKVLWKPSIGVLEVGILSATGLLPMKPSENRTDAYCVAKYGPKWVRTRTATNSLAPKWNEQYVWEVYDPCTVLTVGVFDNNNLQGGALGIDKRIGKVRIRLSTLETNRIYTHSYPLVALQPSGVKRMGEIQLVVRFSCLSFITMLQTYTQPLLPMMHYALPLSVYQLDHLRHQCMAILSERLELAEPKLRREVVHYMLDVDSHLWSIRKARANFDRIAALIDNFIAFCKWFDQIRKWKNPIITALVHIMFILVVIFPEFILPTIFFYLSMAGMCQYWRRPRYPPHMDTKLSHAYSVSLDELAEEFDVFPSKVSGEVLQRRYDRLRHIAGKIQVVMGDVATQGERVQSLLSWRDPRATAMFVCFCLVASIVIYITPFRIVVTSVGVYALRHPRFRFTLPSLPCNFLRRMPARTDSML